MLNQKNGTWYVILAITILVVFFTTKTVTTQAVTEKLAVEENSSNSEDTDLKEELSAIYEAIALNNKTQENILDHHARILHYMSGHTHLETHKACPECALLFKIQIRRNEIEDERRELAEYIATHPNDPKNEEKARKEKELSIEEDKIENYIFRADEQAAKVSDAVTIDAR